MKVRVENQWPDFGLGVMYVGRDELLFQHASVSCVFGPLVLQFVSTRKHH